MKHIILPFFQYQQKQADMINVIWYVRPIMNRFNFSRKLFFLNRAPFIYGDLDSFHCTWYFIHYFVSSFYIAYSKIS